MATETKTEQLLEQMLEEMRAMRALLELNIEAEDEESIDEYAHPERILASYQEAIKDHPPR